MTGVITGATWIAYEHHPDSRGCLSVLHSSNGLPFAARRAFVLRGCPKDASRAEHANREDQLIATLSGQVTADLDNGRERATVSLRAVERALWVRAGVWLRLRDFSRDAVLLVLSERTYDNLASSPTPLPELLFPAS
jgi:WxcM-like protein